MNCLGQSLTDFLNPVASDKLTPDSVMTAVALADGLASMIARLSVDHLVDGRSGRAGELAARAALPKGAN